MTEYLHVWENGIHIGVFSRRNPTSSVAFRYDSDRRDSDHGDVISLSLPRDGSHSKNAPKAFLENLLPDDLRARWRMADRLGIDTTDTFALLRDTDTTGGLAFTEEETYPSTQRVVWPVYEDELAAQIRQVRAAGSNWFARSEHCRFSLAGGQPKFSLARRGGTWLWPDIDTPSTHIVKPEIRDCPNSDFVEDATMRLADLCGLSVAEHGMLHVGEAHAFVTKRFDRRIAGGKILRIHCEDIAQAMGLMPDEKYGIGAADCVRFLRHFDSSDEMGYEFVRRLAFNISSADCDSHGKNYSLFLDDDMIRFTPMYDLNATRTWVHLDQDLAMRVNDVEFADWLTPHDWAEFADRTGLDEERVTTTARIMAGLVLDRMEEATASVPSPQRDAMLRGIEKSNASIEPLRGESLPRSNSPQGTYQTGAVWIRPYERNGYPVSGYWRNR